MPPLTPQITLTADLDSILNGVGVAGFLEITLCGFGPIIPRIPGTCVIADAGVPQRVGPYTGTTLSVKLWGNDVIIPGPDTTFYCISVLDSEQNVIQSNNYRFDGTGTFDLGSHPPIVPPYGFSATALRYLPCTGAVPGTVYTSPGPPVAVAYNGALMVAGLAPPIFSYTAAGNTITLNFTTETGDRIEALCVV